jgi:toxin-antitoxin system PIN domain toxin
MIAVDSSILVYANVVTMPHHGQARACLQEIAEGSETWAIPWPCIHEFLGVVTNPRVIRPPIPMKMALEFVEDMCRSSDLVLLSEGADHRERLGGLLLAGRVVGPVVHDAKVAAICLSHGVTELWTADRDFSLFPALRVRDPLASRL